MKQDIDEAAREAEAKEGIVPVDGKFWDAGYGTPDDSDNSYKMEGKEGQGQEQKQGQGNKGAKAGSWKKKDIYPKQTKIT